LSCLVSYLWNGGVMFSSKFRFIGLILTICMIVPFYALSATVPTTFPIDQDLPSQIVLPQEKLNPLGPEYKNEYALNLDFDTSLGSNQELGIIGSDWTHEQSAAFQGDGSAVFSPTIDGSEADSWLIFRPIDLHESDYANLNLRIMGGENSSVSVMMSIDGMTFHGTQASIQVPNEWLYFNIKLNDVQGLGNLCSQSKVWVAVKASSGPSNGPIFIDNFELRLKNNQLPSANIADVTQSSEILATRDEILDHYAPAIYQKVHTAPFGLATEFADYITSFNYDGNFNAYDNWDNLSSDCGDLCGAGEVNCTPLHPLPAHVYSSMVETETHLFLQYCLFHPADDYKRPSVEFSHENDLEGIILMVRKDGSQFGEPVLLQTQAHLNFYQYLPPSGIGVYNDEEGWDDRFSYYPGTSHPMVVVEEGGHGIKVEALPENDRILYLPGTTAEDPSDVIGAESVSYTLLSTKTAFWDNRFSFGPDNAVFESAGSYNGVRLNADQIGVKFGMTNNLCTIGQASAPWNWSDWDDPFPNGDWFMDPALYHDWQFDFDEELNIEYSDHEFFSYDQLPETTLPRGEWTVIVHGFTSGDIEGQISWMLPLARRIKSMDTSPDDVVIYRMDPNTFSVRSENNDRNIPKSEISDSSKHKIILFDWAETSGLTWSERAGDGYAFAAGDALYAFIRTYGLESSLSSMIGHSRGAVVLTECVRRLTLEGYHANQVIFLDGEGGYRDDFIDSFSDDRFGVVAGTSQYTHYDNIYTEFNEIPCRAYYADLNLGGWPIEEADNYNLGNDYRHGGSAGICVADIPFVDFPFAAPLPSWWYLMSHMGHDGNQFTFRHYPAEFVSGSPIDPNSWNTGHSSGHEDDSFLFNGNFAWGSDSGWKNHGVTSMVETQDTQSDDSFERLWSFNPRATHSFTWISDRHRNLQFSLYVTFSEPGLTPENLSEYLYIYLTDMDGNKSLLKREKINTHPRGERVEISCFIRKGLRDQACTITFEIFDPFLTIISNIKIDDVKLIKDAPEVSPVDVVTCIDRSGSMDNHKIVDAKTAASTFVGLLNTNDKIGVTSFSSSASVDYPLTLIQGQTQKDNAIYAINDIDAGGGTSIGSGMRTSQNQLDAAGSADNPWAIILLSDGISDGSEYGVLPTIPDHTDIYTIGLGAGADEQLMNFIASETGGAYYAAPSSQDLQQIYNSIRGQISGQQAIFSTGGSIVQGGVELLGGIILDGGIGSVTFSISWAGSDIDLILYDPDGTVVDPEIAAIDPDVLYYEGATYEYYTIQDPVPGIWSMELTGVDIPLGGEPFTATVHAMSALSLTYGFTSSSYTTCEPIHLTANLNDAGFPVVGASVFADADVPLVAITQDVRDFIADAEASGEPLIDEVEPARGAAGLIQLFDDGLHGDGAADDGLYGAYFNGTEVSGSYTFNISATGSGLVSGVFSRIGLMTTFVASGNPAAPTAMFAADFVEGYAPLTVSFSNLSTGCISSYEWDFGDGYTSTENSPQHIFESPGDFEVRLTVTGPGGSTVHVVNVAVTEMLDETPPVIIIQSDPVKIWPPNHKYHHIDIADHILMAGDERDSVLSASDVYITSVTCDEEDDLPGSGDGRTVDDIVLNSDCRTLDLRAERQGTGNGRVYSINVGAIDASGNVGTATIVVQVVHDASLSMDELFENSSGSNDDLVGPSADIQAGAIIDDGPVYEVEGCELIVNIEISSKSEDSDEKLNESPQIDRMFLAQNHPNPFNPITYIGFEVPKSTVISLAIYDISGRLVRTLISNEVVPAGRKEIAWKGIDGHGRPVAAGVYFYSLSSADFNDTKRMVLLK